MLLSHKSKRRGFILLFHLCAYINFQKYLLNILASSGRAVVQLVEALRYKPEGREFDSGWCHWNFFY
jgi:hypothetical protein